MITVITGIIQDKKDYSISKLCFISLSIICRTVNGSDNNSDSEEGSSDSQSEVDEADRAVQEQNKKPVSALNYARLSPTKKDRVGFTFVCMTAY